MSIKIETGGGGGGGGISAVTTLLNGGAIYDAGNLENATNLSPANGLIQKCTLITNASVAVGISDPSDTSKASEFLLIFVHENSSDSHAWAGINSTNVDLGGLTATGLLTQVANKKDYFYFTWDGSKWQLNNAWYAR